MNKAGPMPARRGNGIGGFDRPSAVRVSGDRLPVRLALDSHSKCSSESYGDFGSTRGWSLRPRPFGVNFLDPLKFVGGPDARPIQLYHDFGQIEFNFARTSRQTGFNCIRTSAKAGTKRIQFQTRTGTKRIQFHLRSGTKRIQF
jgi:hypothetical protein